MADMPSVSKLPERIAGNDIELRIDAADLWPDIGRLTSAQRAELRREIPWLDTEAIYTDKARYEAWAKNTAILERKMPQRLFWMRNAQGELVGIITARIPENGNVLVTGRMVFSDRRSKGYGTKASRALSDAALASGLVAYVCAETLPDNEASARSLL